MNLRKIAAFAVIGLLLIGMPVVSAQKLEVDSSKTKNPEPLRPEIDTAQVTLAWVYVLDNQAYSPIGVGSSSAQATITVNCPNNVLATGPQSKLVNLAGGSAGAETEYPFEVSYTIAVTRDLQGLKQFECEYKARVGAVTIGTEAIPQTEEAGNKFTVSAKFFSLVQAKVATQIKEAGPQKEVPFEIQVDNFGNARTRIQFSIEERPGGNKWSAVVPDDVILDSPAAGGAKTSDSAVFTIQTPFKNGWNNEQGIYRLAMKTFAADDPEQEGTELKTNMLVRVRGVYVPTLEPMIMLGAVLGAAGLLRMRRED